MKKYLLLVLFALFVLSSCFVKVKDYKEFAKVMDPSVLGEEYKDIMKADEICNSDKYSSLEYFKAGLVYYFNTVDVFKYIEMNNSIKEKTVNKAKTCFDKAFAKEKRNPYILAYRGATYLMLCNWGNVVSKIINSRSGEKDLNLAVRIASSDLEIRNLRARSFTYLPYEFYPNAPATVIEDTDFIIGKIIAGKDKLKTLYSDIRINILLNDAYCEKSIAFSKKKLLKEARIILNNVPNDYYFYKEASEKL